MRYIILIFLFLLTGLKDFSSDLTKLNRSDYIEKINKIVYQLNCDPNNHQAKKRLLKTYSNALIEYQREIARLEADTDSLRWANIYDLMIELNDMSNAVLSNSSASQVICDPKIFTDELSQAKQKAIQELYDAGIHSLRNGSRAKAKEAYFYFVKAEQLSPTFKDVSQKIQEARHKATLNIVVEKVTAQRFYQNFLNQLQSEFRYDRFVNIYSYKEPKLRKIEPIDWYVRISFVNYEIKKSTFYRGSYLIDINIVAEIKIYSTMENKDILSTRIPWQYVWTSFEPCEGDLQGLYYSLSLSMNNDVYDVVSRFITQSKY